MTDNPQFTVVRIITIFEFADGSYDAQDYRPSSPEVATTITAKSGEEIQKFVIEQLALTKPLDKSNLMV